MDARHGVGGAEAPECRNISGDGARAGSAQRAAHAAHTFRPYRISGLHVIV